MALVGPGALTEYTGGPRSSRRRGFVSVNEPACGFFITGSSIDPMNGVYGRVNTDAIWSHHTILLAYRNDSSMKWILALVERTQTVMQQKRRFTNYRRHARLQHSSSSESEEEVEEETREWLFIDENGRDRFMHDGDTIIPGAGVSWKHVHRGTSQAGRNIRRSESTALQTQGPDDEDELPWQVIAILDRQTMRDMRYTQRCYEANIQTAMSGKNLPKPALAGIDASTQGCWLFKVVAPSGVEVYIEPSSKSPLVGHRETGEYVQGVARRDQWLKIASSVGSVLEKSFSDDLWVQVENSNGTAYLVHVAEEDMPNMEAEPIDQPEADLFDRPFEPRLEDPNAKEEAEQEDEEDDDIVFSTSIASENHYPLALPPRGVELALGTEVSLEGLNKESVNGSCATVVTKMTEDRRQGVRLKSNGQKISIKVGNLRAIAAGEDGEFGRHARILGLSLRDLSLGHEGADLLAESQRLAAQQLLAAAFRATDRDLESGSDGARRDAESAQEALANRLAMLKVSASNHEAEKTCDHRKSVDSEATTAASNLDAHSPHSASPEDSPTDQHQTPPAPGKAPHEIVEDGALGARSADAARLASSSNSALNIDSGVTALRELLGEEQCRVRKSMLSRISSTPGDSQDTGEGPDALRLRLTLVRALLRGRREVEAGKEAGVARRLHPSSSAAALWCGRCLLRLGGGNKPREEGLRLLSLAASEASGVDGLWAATEAKKRLMSARRAERAERKAKDAYARGIFADAVKHYSEAIDNADSLGDDKWLRAELRSNRASCYRRARELRAAITDLDIALSFFPRYKRGLFRRGVCLLEAGCPKEAITTLETLLGLDREWPNLLDWLVRAHALRERQGTGTFKVTTGNYGASSASIPSFTDGGGWAEAAEEKDIASEKNHYTVLGVSTDATEKQLKRAYRVMSLKFHPDKEGGSTRAFQRIATAYQTLSDPEKRQLYDEGADLKQHAQNSDSDSDNEREKKSLREEIERKYFPERYKFWPFGDPFVQKRKRQEKQRQRAGKPAFYEDDI